MKKMPENVTPIFFKIVEKTTSFCEQGTFFVECLKWDFITTKEINWFDLKEKQSNLLS